MSSIRSIKKNHFDNIKNVLILCADRTTSSNFKGLKILQKFFNLKEKKWHYLNMVYLGDTLDTISNLKTTFIKIDDKKNFIEKNKRVSDKDYDFEIVSSKIINTDLKELSIDDFNNVLNVKFDVIINEACPMLEGIVWAIKPEHFIHLINHNLKPDGYYIDLVKAKNTFRHFDKFYTELLNEDLIDDEDGRHVLFSRKNLDKYADGLKNLKVSKKRKQTRKRNRTRNKTRSR